MSSESRSVGEVVRAALSEGAAAISYTEKEVEAAVSYLWQRFRDLNAAAAEREVSQAGVTAHAPKPGDAELTCVPVPRLAVFVEESLRWGLHWAVSEPNGETLWAKVHASTAGLLQTLRLRGVLQGTTAEEAYVVRCDATTMTPADIDNGTLNIVVGLALHEPAEFVIIEIGMIVQSGA
jgi:hypothetical protein